MVDKKNSLVETSDVLKQNLQKLDVLTKRFVTVVQKKKSLNPGLQGPGQDLTITASAAYWPVSYTHLTLPTKRIV